MGQLTKIIYLMFSLFGFYNTLLYSNHELSETENILNFYKESEIKGETSLLQSFYDSSFYLDNTHSKNLQKMNQEYLGKQSFVYDMAIASIVYLLTDHIQKAQNILNDFYDNFRMPKNGLLGLYNSYRFDRYDHYIPSPSGKKNLLIIGIDGSRIHAGPNLWVGIACEHHFMKTGSVHFLPFIIDIFNWCKNLNHYTFKDGQKGGISMGYGWGTDWRKVYSTEHNIDYYAFLNNLKTIYQLTYSDNKSLYQKEQVTLKDIDNEIDGTLKFLKLTYSESGTFIRGFNEYGRDEVEALDATSWGVAGLGPQLMFDLGIDPDKMIETAEKEFLASVQLFGDEFEGFDFTNFDGYSQQRKEGCIWFEGTSQMIVMYQVMHRYYKEKEQTELSGYYLNKANHFRNEIKRFSSYCQLKNNALPYTSINCQTNDIVYCFNDWWPIARGKNGQWVRSLIATSWTFFADQSFNPLSLDNYYSKT